MKCIIHTFFYYTLFNNAAQLLLHSALWFTLLCISKSGLVLANTEVIRIFSSQTCRKPRVKRQGCVQSCSFPFFLCVQTYLYNTTNEWEIPYYVGKAVFFFKASTVTKTPYIWAKREVRRNIPFHVKYYRSLRPFFWCYVTLSTFNQGFMKWSRIEGQSFCFMSPSWLSSFLFMFQQPIFYFVFPERSKTEHGLEPWEQL